MNLPGTAADDVPTASDAARAARTPSVEAGDAIRRAAARRRLDEIFGDVLPDVTRDELDDRAGEAGPAAERDAWYRANLPPHHG